MNDWPPHQDPTNYPYSYNPPPGLVQGTPFGNHPHFPTPDYANLPPIPPQAMMGGATNPILLDRNRSDAATYANGMTGRQRLLTRAIQMCNVKMELMQLVHANDAVMNHIHADAVLRKIVQLLSGRPLRSEPDLFHLFSTSVQRVLLDPDTELRHSIGVWWCSAKARFPFAAQLQPILESKILSSPPYQWNPQAIANLFFSYAMLDLSPTPPVLDLLTSALLRHAERFEAQATVNTLQALARLGLRRLFATAARRLESKLREHADGSRTLTTQAIGSLLVAYANAGVRPSPDVVQSLVSLVESRADEFDGQGMTNTMLSLARLEGHEEFARVEARFRPRYVNNNGGLDGGSNNNAFPGSNAPPLQAHFVPSLLAAFRFARLDPPREVFASLVSTLVQQGVVLKANELSSALVALIEIGRAPPLDATLTLLQHVRRRLGDVDRSSALSLLWGSVVLGTVLVPSAGADSILVELVSMLLDLLPVLSGPPPVNGAMVPPPPPPSSPSSPSSSWASWSIFDWTMLAEALALLVRSNHTSLVTQTRFQEAFASATRAYSSKFGDQMMGADGNATLDAIAALLPVALGIDSNRVVRSCRCAAPLEEQDAIGTGFAPAPIALLPTSTSSPTASPSSSSSSVAIAVILQAWEDATRNTARPLGRALLRRALLEACGWRVVVISAAAWEAAPSEEEKKALLRREVEAARQGGNGVTGLVELQRQAMESGGGMAAVAIASFARRQTTDDGEEEELRSSLPNMAPLPPFTGTTVGTTDLAPLLLGADALHTMRRSSGHQGGTVTPLGSSPPSGGGGTQDPLTVQQLLHQMNAVRAMRNAAPPPPPPPVPPPPPSPYHMLLAQQQQQQQQAAAAAAAAVAAGIGGWGGNGNHHSMDSYQSRSNSEGVVGMNAGPYLYHPHGSGLVPPPPMPYLSQPPFMPQGGGGMEMHPPGGLSIGSVVGPVGLLSSTSPSTSTGDVMYPPPNSLKMRATSGEGLVTTDAASLGDLMGSLYVSRSSNSTNSGLNDANRGD